MSAVRADDARSSDVLPEADEAFQVSTASVLHLSIFLRLSCLFLLCTSSWCVVFLFFLGCVLVMYSAYVKQAKRSWYLGLYSVN